jgi:hypothetical protein
VTNETETVVEAIRVAMMLLEKEAVFVCGKSKESREQEQREEEFSAQTKGLGKSQISIGGRHRTKS